jgi:hypothetical protein
MRITSCCVCLLLSVLGLAVVHLGRIKMYRAVSALQPTCEKENACKILTSTCQNCLEISASLSSHIHKTKFLPTYLYLTLTLYLSLTTSLHISLFIYINIYPTLSLYSLSPSLSLSLPLSYPHFISLSSSISPSLLTSLPLSLASFLKAKKIWPCKKRSDLTVWPSSRTWSPSADINYEMKFSNRNMNDEIHKIFKSSIDFEMAH